MNVLRWKYWRQFVTAIFIGISLNAIAVEYPHPDTILAEAKTYRDSLQKVYTQLTLAKQKTRINGTIIKLDSTKFYILHNGLEDISSKADFKGNYILKDTINQREIIGYFPTSDFAKGFHLEVRSGTFYKASIYTKTHQVTDIYFNEDGTIKSSEYGWCDHFYPSKTIYKGDALEFNTKYSPYYFKAGIALTPKARYTYKNDIFSGFTCYPTFKKSSADIRASFATNGTVTYYSYYNHHSGSPSLYYSITDSGKKNYALSLLNKKGKVVLKEHKVWNDYDIVRYGAWWIPIPKLIKLTNQGISISELKEKDRPKEH